jgi:type IV secretory pathway TraG/TraD family ATPase VirD4
MTPDEVRKMDNKKCLIFICGFDPILDNKYNPSKHPVFSQTADGDGRLMSMSWQRRGRARKRVLPFWIRSLLLIMRG